MARANIADEEIVWDTPDEEITWDEPKKKGPALSAAERFVYGLRAPIDGGTQLAVQANRFLADKGVVPKLKGEDLTKGERERKAAYEAGKPEGFDWAHLAGNVLSPGTLALSVIPGATIPRAMALGAAGGALEPVQDEGEGFWAEKGSQAAMGAAGGGASNVALRSFGRLVSPNASRNTDLQLLRREGVEPTIGQAMGGRVNATEEKLTSVPLLGDGIAKARGRARDGFNVAAINRATAPVGGPRVTQAGQQGVDEAHRAVDAAYDAARALGPVRLDRTATQELRRLSTEADRLGLDQRLARDNLWADVGTQITPAGRIIDYKAVTSMLGRDAGEYAGSTAPLDRKLGRLLGEANDTIKDAAWRGNSPAAQAFSKADRGFSNLAIVENAAKQADKAEGVFTPAQLLTAVKQGDKSARKNATSRGLAHMQDLGTAGQNVIGNKVPDSGTAGRLGWGVAGVGSGFGFAVEPVTTAAILSGLAAGRLAYTPAVQRLLVAMASRRPAEAAAAREALRQIAAHSAPAAGAATGLLDDDFTDY